MVKLFVSYARDDLPIVETLVTDLRELGHEVFYDQSLAGGQNWWNVLLDQIQAAEGFLPTLSEEYRRSEACHREAQWAAALRIPFLPIDLGQVGPELCDPVVANANWVRYDLQDRTAVARLARGVATLPPVVPVAPMPPRPTIPITYFAELEREIRTSASLPLERQLLVISTLRDKLGTREDATARTMLTELRMRNDITYANAVELDSLLQLRQNPEPRPTRKRFTAPPVYQQQVGPQPPPQPMPQPPPQPAPWPGPAVDSGVRLRSPGTALALLVAGGWLLMLLALFAFPWLSAGSSDVDFNDIRGAISSAGYFSSFSVGYFEWFGLVLCVLIAALAVVPCFGSRRRGRLGWIVPVLALVTILITVLVMNSIIGDDASHGEHDSRGFGFWVLLIGLAAVGVAAFAADRRKAAR